MKYMSPKVRHIIGLLTIVFSSLYSYSQSISVSGRITDQRATGLQGVTVHVKNAQIDATTKADGSYSITVPNRNAVLTFSYAGFASQEIAVGDQSVINVSLIPQGNLEDVVVIGYGTQKRKNVTGAVTSFNTANIDERAIQRVDQALVGQMAGVTVRQTTGIPGKAFSIQIRGSGSISGGNEPLYVLDGFPLAVNSSNSANGTFTSGNPLDNINPNDIESIEVLKDAAAAAIYGSRASNGVVLITTKRGKTGKPKIDVNAYGGYSEATRKLNMMNGEQWIDNAIEVINATYVAAFKNQGATANDDMATRLAKNGGNFSANYIPDPRWFQQGHPGLRSIDWQDAILRKGKSQNYTVSASGGTEAVRYFVSANYGDQEGMVMNTGYKSYALRGNVEIKPTKNFKLGINIAPTYSITQDPGVEGQNNIFHQALSMSPLQEDSVGLLANIGKNAPYTYSNTTNSPYGKLLYNKGTTKRYRTIGTAFAEYQLIKGLNIRSSVNLDNTDNIATTYVPYITTGSSLANRTYTGNTALTSANSGTYNSYRKQTFVNENTLTYNTTINSDHSINALVGHAYNAERLDRIQVNSSGGFTNATIETLNSASSVILVQPPANNPNAITNGATRNVLISYFSRVQYGYKDKYLLSLSYRIDGSSRFGVNNKWGKFPSASVAWRIVDEKFMSRLPVISDLKFRASYGVNGNNNLPNDYPSIATIGNYNYVVGTTQASAIGQAPNVLANPDLKWEKSETFDIGVDFGILGNRITGSFDVYNKLNTDLLLNVQVPAVTGFATYLSNVGSVRNIGQELELTSRNLVGKFQWTTSLNVSHNKNHIVALAPGQNQIIVPNGNNVADQILRVGSPLNSIYVLKVVGFLTAQDISSKVATYGSGEAEGDFRFEDLNQDGVITEADKQIMGHPNPDYTYGITNTFSYKGFDLNVLVQGQRGGSIYSELGRALTRPGQGRTDNHPASFDKRWKSPTDQGEGRFSKTYATYNTPIAAASDWIYSSNYIRVRNITLGYNLKNVIKVNSIQGIRLYVTLENFFGHDKYTNGLNPEGSNTTISSNPAFPQAGDYGGLPLPRALIAGLNVTF